MQNNIKDIRETLRNRDWSEITDVLWKINEEDNEEDAEKIKDMIPELLRHSNWVVRAECLELIGYFRFAEFLPLAKKRLKDTNQHVRAYALASIYDVEKKDSLALLRRYAKNTNVGVRIMALSLLYVETKSPEVLAKIEKIVTRKNCNYRTKSAVISQFEYYFEIKKHPEIIDLYKKMLKVTPPRFGVAKNLKKILKEIKK